MEQPHEFPANGFAIIENIYTPHEIDNILQRIDSVSPDKETFSKSANLFAILQ